MGTPLRVVISGLRCHLEKAQICGVVLVLAQVSMLSAAHEQEWSCSYTYNGAIICRKRLIQVGSDTWSQRSSRNTDPPLAERYVRQYFQTAANNVQNDNNGKLACCVSDWPTNDQDKRTRDTITYNRLAHLIGELLQRTHLKGSIQDADETNTALQRPGQYSPAGQGDESEVPSKYYANVLRNNLEWSSDNVGKEGQPDLRNNINEILTQCVQRILNTLAAYAFKHLAHCNRKQAANADALKSQVVRHFQLQKAVQKEDTSQWPRYIALVPEHILAEDELRKLKATAKKRGDTTFEKRHQQRYNVKLVPRIPQQEGIENTLDDIISLYLRNRLNTQSSGAPKIVSVHIENQSKTNVRAEVGSNGNNHRAVPARDHAQRILSAVWQSKQNSESPLPIFSGPRISKGDDESRKPQVAMKRETLAVNNVKTSRPFIQPPKGAPTIYYSRESALNRQRVSPEGQVTKLPRSDVALHMGFNAQNKESLRHQNRTTASKSVRRILKQSVRGYSQDKQQQEKYSGRIEIVRAELREKPSRETWGGYLPPERQHRNSGAVRKQRIIENLSSQNAEGGVHEHVVKELRDSLQFLEENTVHQSVVAGSQGKNGERSRMVKTVGKAGIKRLPTSLWYSKLMTTRRPHNYRSKTPVMPQDRLILFQSKNTGAQHNSRSDVKVQDHGDTDSRPSASQSIPRNPAVWQNPANEKQSILPYTQNRIFNHPSQNVAIKNHEPLPPKGKQDKEVSNGQRVRLITQAQPPTTVKKQVSKQNMTVQKSSMQRKPYALVTKSRHNDSQRNSAPISGTKKHVTRKSASGYNEFNVVQPTYVYKKAAVHAGEPTSKNNPTRVQPRKASKSHKAFVTTKPLPKSKPRPVSALKPISRDRSKSEPSGFKTS